MRRAVIILMAGLAAALSAYFIFAATRLGPGRQAGGGEHSEIEWLRGEFHLSDQDFGRIAQLHEKYLPRCQEMCARIEAKQREVQQLILKTNSVTPEIEQKLSEAAGLRRECQTAMLRHFYEVSQAMPPEQARRYLEKMAELTSISAVRAHPSHEHGD